MQMSAIDISEVFMIHMFAQRMWISTLTNVQVCDTWDPDILLLVTYHWIICLINEGLSVKNSLIVKVVIQLRF